VIPRMEADESVLEQLIAESAVGTKRGHLNARSRAGAVRRPRRRRRPERHAKADGRCPGERNGVARNGLPGRFVGRESFARPLLQCEDVSESDQCAKMPREIAQDGTAQRLCLVERAAPGGLNGLGQDPNSIHDRTRFVSVQAPTLRTLPISPPPYPSALSRRSGATRGGRLCRYFQFAHSPTRPSLSRTIGGGRRANAANADSLALRLC